MKKRGTFMAIMQINRFTVDSRLVEPGGIFFALKGGQTDGHLFLKEASLKGAKKAYVDRGYQGAHFGLELCPVESPLKTLQALAANRLLENGPLTIGVTGSFAKTTTKETLADAISLHSGCYRSYKNANSQTGIPLGILNQYQDEPYAVIEMGIEHFSDMDSLVEMVKPDIAVITRIAPAHLQTLYSLENIAKEKGKIIHPTKTEWVFLHHSVTPYLEFFPLEGKKIIFYGQPLDELFEDIKDLCKKVLEVLHFFPSEIKIPTLENRLEEFIYPKGVVVMDCYNANPTTMVQFFSLKCYQDTKRRKIAIIGQMASLGETADFFHKKVAEEIHDKIDMAFIVGEGALALFEVLKNSQKKVFFAKTIEELKPFLIQHIAAEDLVLVKGSNLNRLWELKPCLQQVMS
ncbi:MAG: UDP-N-acetylmuramoyl-tripeptide--D-alanyl-D-alanine ligase [Chlamydiae bacterium]|nr:UDP-N-acetylmuramoyl-tripeptide--D-alanyl-D-alanine ligase [Chlamydiota bacterium]